ncbi:MAG: ISKra4 family transposase [Isosphaeraceae bacterium]
MLAPTTAAVKFDLPATPEQQACRDHIDQGLKTFWSLVERLHHAADRHQPMDQVEETIFRDLLVIGRWMLQAFLDFAGPGDVGPTLTIRGDRASEADRELPRLDRPRKRPYLSIFGAIDIERIGYGRDRVEAAPLDARLHLPERQYSYLLQRWLGAFVVDDAHAEAIGKLESILGLEIAVKASEDLNREQASDVEVFQDSLPIPAARDEGPLLVVAADCKGVPLVRKAVREPDEPPGGAASRGHRRGKGEKANKKRMAAVGAVYTIEPFVRTADDVIDEVMRKEARRRRPGPRNKRVRAELLVGKVALFLWLAQETIRRNPRGTKPVIFLSDGERALHDRQGEYLPENTICILDLFHVLERLWKVAWCFFDERAQKRQAHQWVEERLRRLLEGKVDSVIRGIRYQATHHGLKGQQRKTARDAADYFEWNRDRMKYDEYLAAGYPIGSGVVEGACRHLVKDRMERTGMRWLPSGAQAMLDLRATYLNGEWNDFWKFHVEREDQRLYGKMRGTG